MVETRNDVDDGTEKQLTRYQMHNHLGSAAMELDTNAAVISYEEYHPYGTTAYQAKNTAIKSAAKRYRFTGMERDEESGLEYHSARYYIPWMARWLNGDPIGMGDGINVYSYCCNSPTRRIDKNGRQSGDAQEIMMAMMWDQMGAELSAMWTGVFGGSAYISPRTNVVQISPPSGGVGGVTGGVIREATFRIAPIEDNPTPSSLIGMEMGGGLVPVAGPANRLLTGESVIGLPTSRAWAGAELALDVFPFLWEARAASIEARMLSTETRMLSTDTRLLREADTFAHIGSSERRVGPSITNPTCRGDLCVADVGAHEANRYLTPGQSSITNTEFVEAAGRPVSRVEAPIENAGEANNFLEAGFEGLNSRGRTTRRVTATIPPDPRPRPGTYAALVRAKGGAHALHATVREEIIGTRYLSEKRFVTPSEAADIAADGGRVVERPVYATEFYDPQAGTCVMPSEEVTSYIRFQ